MKKYFLLTLCIIATLITAHTAALAASAMRWSTLLDASAMEIYTGRQGIAVPAYDPEIYFEPKKLRASKIILRANLDMGFIPPEKQPEMMNTNMSNTGVVAQTDGYAVFTSNEIERTGKNQFIARGILELNGRRKRQDVPFSISLESYKNANSSKLIMRGHMDIQPGQFIGGALIHPGSNIMKVTFNYHLIPYGR